MKQYTRIIFVSILAVILAFVITLIFSTLIIRRNAGALAPSAETEPLMIQWQWAKFCTDYGLPFGIKYNFDVVGDQYSDTRIVWVTCQVKGVDYEYHPRWVQGCLTNTPTTAPLLKEQWWTAWSHKIICYKEGTW